DLPALKILQDITLDLQTWRFGNGYGRQRRRHERKQADEGEGCSLQVRWQHELRFGWCRLFDGAGRIINRIYRLFSLPDSAGTDVNATPSACSRWRAASRATRSSNGPSRTR